jgi:hypothetical protein
MVKMRRATNLNGAVRTEPIRRACITFDALNCPHTREINAAAKTTTEKKTIPTAALQRAKYC